MRLAQTAGMSPSQNYQELVAMTLRCEDMYEKNAQIEISIEQLDLFVRQDMREYLSTKKKPNLHHLVIYATSLLRLQRRDVLFKNTQPTSAGQGTTNNWAPHGKSTWESFRSGTHTIELRKTFGLLIVSRNFSGTPVMATDSCKSQIDTASSLIAIMASLSTLDNAQFCWVCRRENYQTSQWPFIRMSSEKVFHKFWDSNYKAYRAWNDCNKDCRGWEMERSSRKGHRSGSSQKTRASVNEQRGSKSANPTARA